MFLRVLCVSAVMGEGAEAQSNAERVIGGYYTPSHDYDLIHQRIEVKNFDWDSTAFDGKVTTTVVALRPGLDSLVLDMAQQLEVKSITPVCARTRCPPLAFSHPSDSLVVRLGRAARLGDTVRFTVDYHGRIRQGRGLYFFTDEPGRPHRPQQVYSGGGTDGNPRWIPTWGGPADKATWDLIATVPKRFTVLSNGRLVSDRVIAGGMRTTEWTQEKPASTYLISLVVAPLAKVSDRWHGLPVDYYVYAEDRVKARALFGVTPDMIEVYSRLTGVRYPWNKYAQVTVADFVGGMENVSATTLVDWLPDSAAYHDRPWFRWALIPHELAHQWFGDLVTTENWANYWLNEGMAEFMPGQYWGIKMGPGSEEDYYLSEYRDFLAADKRRRMPLAAWNSNNVYPKGALVLEMLKKQLGSDRFWAGINRYLTRHAYRSATSDDLRQAFLEASGESLDWFWSQWIYRAGYPAFTVTSTYDSAGRSLALLVRQTQTDTATADSSGLRFETPLVFRAPAAIRVGTAGGDTVVRAVIDRREQTIRIEGLSGPPTMVVFDDDNAIVKTLVFDQATPWLAAQLAREGGALWNRAWAIDQLRARRADSTAAAALALAAQKAGVATVRALSAGALGDFSSPAVLPALLTASRDTSAAVRKAAVTALGSIPGDQSLALIRDAWTKDPSYETRAAALTTLSRRDPSARGEILEGLETPSYRDVIQNAAIVAGLRQPDTALVTAIARHAADQPLPTVALAVLSARGDSAALGALAAVLDDDRAWVRGWAIDAVEQQLDPDDALAVLQGVLPAVRKDVARAAIEEAVGRVTQAKN